MAGAPKYLAIAAALRERIDRGDLEPGERLPAQAALAGEFGVTIMTLRQALSELEREGLVRAVRGTGTFVSERPAVRLGLDHLWSFVREMEYQGTPITTEVLTVDVDPADEAASRARAALGVDDGVELARIVRRRSIGGEPVVVQHSTIAVSDWARIEHLDLASVSLYGALEQQCGHRIERASETFRAVAAGATEATMLGVADGAPCLESTRVSMSTTGPFLFDRAVLLGSAAEVQAERTASSLHLGYRAT